MLHYKPAPPHDRAAQIQIVTSNDNKTYRNPTMSHQDNKRADLKKRLAKEREEINTTTEERTDLIHKEKPNPLDTNPGKNDLPILTHHQAPKHPQYFQIKE